MAKRATRRRRTVVDVPGPDPMRQIEEIYASLPAVECRGKCQNACGPIDMSEAERSLIRDRGIEIPAFSRERSAAWSNDEKWPTCPALGSFGQCRVYDVRPLICRLWGVAESMPCPHGCRPERYLTDEEAYELIIRVATLGGSRLTSDPQLGQVIQAALAHPSIRPALRRFIRGDQTVGPELERMLYEHRKELAGD